MLQNSKEAHNTGSEVHLRFSWKIALPVSLVLSIPCFWQSRIQAVDLSSHIYNAWLASLIVNNQAPGLWIGHQSNNVLFDLMLAWLFQHFGAAAAQRIAVGVSVLIFSWGAILLISRGRPRNWWFLLPSVAVLSYGFIFHAGFFNFYLGLGICIWYLAFFLPGGWRVRLLATPLLFLAWTAHPLPVLWAVGLAAYTVVAEFIPAQGRIILLVVGLLVLMEAHLLLVNRYECLWSVTHAWYAMGPKQMMLFEGRYDIAYWLILGAWGILFYRRARASRLRNVIPNIGFQLWLLTAAAVVSIPNVIGFPQYQTPFSFVTFRFSLGAAVLLCGFLFEVQPNIYERVMLTLGALIFFGILFRDVRSLNRMEDRVDAALAQLPANSRVIGRLRVPSRDFSPGVHAVDRACIGHCFSYANYEPSTGQFRVRASPGNPIVMADYADVYAVETGQYRVQARDLPVYLVFLCGPDKQKVCTQELDEGDVIGRVGREP